tara:strand:+ start:450 stop:587 length:138 start_codon:yes stop_codon:yes gene_type:complete
LAYHGEGEVVDDLHAGGFFEDNGDESRDRDIESHGYYYRPEGLFV